MAVSPYRGRPGVLGPGAGGMGSRPVGGRGAGGPYRLGRGSVYGAADPAFKKSQSSAAKHLKQEAKKQMHGRGPKSMPMMLKKGGRPRRRDSVMTGKSRGKPYRSY